MGFGGSKAEAKDGGGGGGKGGKAGQDEAGKEKQMNESFQTNLRFLMKVPIFQKLPMDEHPTLAEACENKAFKPGELIMKQGDVGSDFFVIKEGTAEVFVNKDGAEANVANLKAGDFFGEAALIREEPRMATVKATTAMTTLRITRDKFKELGLNEKLQFKQRLAVGGGNMRNDGPVVPDGPTEKTAAQQELIATALQSNKNLQTMVHLEEKSVKAIVDVAWKKSVSAGEELIKKGDLVADFFYIVEEGKYDVFLGDGISDAEAGPTSVKQILNGATEPPVATVERGGSFGELALLYLSPRAATVVAHSSGVLWVVGRKHFKNILMAVSEARIQEYVQILTKCEILTGLQPAEYEAIANALQEQHFQANEIIFEQGAEGNNFYILYSGSVSVIKDEKSGAGPQEVNRMTSTIRGQSHIFGERALLSKEERNATLKVTSETADVLVLDRESFEFLLGPLEDILKEAADGRTGNVDPKGKKPVGSFAPTAEKIDRADLEKLGLLGCGGFGAVELHMHKKTKMTYAMKCLSKGYIVKTHMQESVMNEKYSLQMCNSPFVIRLYATYNGKQMLYFLMEAALGGELYATYNRKGFHGSDKHCKFYSAGVVNAFEYIHERRVIYRDLKPENILMDAKGMFKLTDMGLAKFVIGKTYTTCGTPDYFAPEIIASTGHTKAVDWWTVGILIFELMSGHPPFESNYPMQIYNKVMMGISKVHFPPKCTGEPGDVIRGLLNREPTQRLPMRPGGVQNLKTQKWFQIFDWDKFAKQEMTPPYTPVVKNPKDMANFSARLEDRPQQISYVDDGTGWDKDFEVA